jgi:hemoglobin
MRHAPFAIGVPERNRWLSLMNQAMDELEWHTPKKKALVDFFEQVAEFLRNQ